MMRKYEVTLALISLAIGISAFTLTTIHILHDYDSTPTNTEHNVWLETQLVQANVSIETVDIHPTVIIPVFNITEFLGYAKANGVVYYALNDYYYSNYFTKADVGYEIFAVYSWAGEP